MMWDLPISVEINGTDYAIRNKCDYRVVLDAINVLNDTDLNQEEKTKCSLFIFFEEAWGIKDVEQAVTKMFQIIDMNDGEQPIDKDENKPRIMDWAYDFPQLAPPISRVLGYSVRDASHYTHWYDFLGAYMEIGECTFSTIITIRSKKTKRQKVRR